MKRGDGSELGSAFLVIDHRSGGLGGRWIATEQADAGWILKVCERKEHVEEGENKGKIWHHWAHL